jgi:hypothetical protein
LPHCACKASATNAKAMRAMMLVGREQVAALTPSGE